MPKPVEGTSPYLPGLDGIRAIAVLAVIAYHLNFGWAPGGLLGVQVFFVLSGYLITDLLVAEYGRHHGIGLKNFWIRRARRLLPALFVMMFVTIGWATLFDRDQLTALRSDVLPGIFYASNWWFIFQHVSSFALRASLVVGHRGAVLPDLAAGPAGRVPLDPRQEEPGAAHLGAVCRLGHRDGRSLLARRRSHPGLRRDRHSGLRPPHRRGAGHGAAPQP